ncbi:hypothetical protein [Thermococcus sp.]
MSRTTSLALVALLIFSLLFTSGSVHAEGGGSYIQVDMLAINTTILPGSGDAIAIVHAKMYEWVPVFDRFNFSELNRYNLTEVLWDTVYTFYLNSSGAYLLYEGDKEGAPVVQYSEKRRTWYFRFHLGEVNPLFMAFLQSKGYNVSRDVLKGYLVFNGPLAWTVSRLPADVTAMPGYPHVEGMDSGDRYLVNFTVDYSSPAYAHAKAGYSWTVPGELVRKNLGLTAPVLTMAVPNLINCTEGTFEGEEYCFPVDKPGWMYLYYNNLRIVYYGNGSFGEVHNWNRTILMAWTKWEVWKLGKIPPNRTIRLMGEEMIPITSAESFNEYRVALYNFTTNSTRTFSLLRILKNPPSLEIASEVSVFRPKLFPEGNQTGGVEGHLGATSSSTSPPPGRTASEWPLAGIGVGLMAGAIIGYLLGRRR